MYYMQKGIMEMKNQDLKQTYSTVLTEKSYQELYFCKSKDTALTAFCLLFLNKNGWLVIFVFNWVQYKRHYSPCYTYI